VARKGKRVTVARSEAPSFLAKAEQFLQEASEAVGGSRADAAMLNAIHAAVSAADAVATALVGQRSADPDHTRAADLLEELAGGSSEVRAHARQFRTLLARKNVVEYESRRATAGEAKDAVARATRLVDWAGGVVREATR
jgi:HEPN domain-containing protein